MAQQYLDYVRQNAPINQVASAKVVEEVLVDLTLRVDADCMVLVDGEYRCNLEASKITKIQITMGEHILEFAALENPDVKVEKIVDVSTPGKKYLVIVSELASAICNHVSEKPQESAPVEIGESKKIKELESVESITHSRAESEKPKPLTYRERLAKRGAEIRAARRAEAEVQKTKQDAKTEPSKTAKKNDKSASTKADKSVAKPTTKSVKKSKQQNDSKNNVTFDDLKDALILLSFHVSVPGYSETYRHSIPYTFEKGKLLHYRLENTDVSSATLDETFNPSKYEVRLRMPYDVDDYSCMQEFAEEVIDDESEDYIERLSNFNADVVDNKFTFTIYNSCRKPIFTYSKVVKS